MSLKIHDFGQMVSNHKAIYMCVASARISKLG